MKFLAGLTKLEEICSTMDFTELLQKETFEESSTEIDFSISFQVMCMVQEAHRGNLLREVLDADTVLEFTCEDHFDYSTLGYCISCSSCKWILSIGKRIEKENVKCLIDEFKKRKCRGGVIIGLRGTIEDYGNTFEGCSISLEGLNMMFRELNTPLHELSLILPGECSNIVLPNFSSLQILTIKVTRSMNWRLDSLLPSLSLQSFTIGSVEDIILSLEDSAAIASLIANTTSLEELCFFCSGGILFTNDSMTKITAAMVKNKRNPLSL